MECKGWGMLGILALAMVVECTQFNEAGGGGFCREGSTNVSSSCVERRSDVEGVTGDDIMDSETNVRQLAARRKAIGYEALRQNALPCNVPGRSYYACQGGGPANPYTRGCHAATGCRRVYN